MYDTLLSMASHLCSNTHKCAPELEKFLISSIDVSLTLGLDRITRPSGVLGNLFVAS